MCSNLIITMCLSSAVTDCYLLFCGELNLINQKTNYTTVNLEIFARNLFLRITLKDKFINNSRLDHDLPSSVNGKMILPFLGK